MTRVDDGFMMLTQLRGAAPLGGWVVDARVIAAWAATPNGVTLPVFEFDAEDLKGTAS